ncbi:MAG: outer membrane protein assembly factor BamE [Candidatus Omnitrophica bacterium]|nr:outer membrane protein assembly factor BamE [Candidatus Omnitrophota bacterium]
MKQFYLIIIGLILISGCASTMKTTYGNKNIIPENVSKIVKGATTQAEILTMFGEPMSKMRTGILGTMWTYSLAKSKHRSGLFTSSYQASSYGLTINFDDNGVVKDYSYIETNPVQPLEISIE